MNSQKLLTGAIAVPFGLLLANGGNPLLGVMSVVGSVALVKSADVNELTSRISHQQTHSVTFAMVFGLVVAVTGWIIADQYPIYLGIGATTVSQINPLELSLVGYMVGTQSVTGHLAYDGLTDDDVHPFWPIRSWGFSIDGLRYIDPRENDGRYVLGTIVLTVVVTIVLLGTF